MKARFTPEAEADIALAISWYRTEAPGLELDFERDIDARLAVIRRLPDGFPIAAYPIRRALLRRFPYGLFYGVHQDAIVIVALLHTSRDPEVWRLRRGFR